MSARKQMNLETKTKILTLHEMEISNREISRRVGYSEAAVRKFLKNYRESKSLDRKPRPSKVPARDLRRLKILALANRFATAGELKRELTGTYYGSKTTRTIQKALKKMGLLSRKPAEKPLLTAKMRTNRRNWAAAHENWTTGDWSRVIFSDESRFNLIGPDGSRRVRRRKGERFSDKCIQPTVKHSPSVMFWGCMTAYGLGDLVFIKGTMNAEKYIKTIQDHVLPAMEDLTQYTSSPTFQDDSAPCHRAKTVSF